MKHIVFFLFIVVLFASCISDNTTHETESLEQSYYEVFNNNQKGLANIISDIGLNELMEIHKITKEDFKNAIDKYFKERQSYNGHLTLEEEEKLKNKYYSKGMIECLDLVIQNQNEFDKRIDKLKRSLEDYNSIKIGNWKLQ